MKKALITGITGQDGSYLSEYLLNLGYRVHGLVRPETLSDPKNNMWRIRHIRDHLILHPGSLQDYPFLLNLFAELKPQECYHLSSQSFVNHTFDEEITTMTTNVNGTLHILSAIKISSPECRLFFPGSSEMFGKVDLTPQTELTPFRPHSVYGISKTCGYDLMRYYRQTHNLFTASGILYNHESPRRGDHFVTRKITSTAAKIKLGLENEIHLGNIDAKRDWGHAQDFVRAMHMMVNRESPEDYVIATGKSHSVKDFLEIAFGELELDYNKYLVIDPDLIRENDSMDLVGDTKKAWTSLGWKANISFEEMVREMVASDLESLKKSI